MGEEKKDKLKLFLENFVVYGIGGIIGGVIPLIMVPIVLRIMPSSDYYGVSDLSNTLVAIGSAIAISGMYDAMYRLFFEKTDEEYKKRICSTAFFYTLISSLVVFVIMLIFRVPISKLFLGDENLELVIFFSATGTLVTATNSIVSAPTRMQNKRSVFLITNAAGPLISYSIAIPLLLKGYYLLALPLTAVISGLTIELSFGVMNSKWFSLKKVDSQLLKQLLVIALPLLPNFIIYWLISSCDKVMITNIIGLGAAGVYSVGSKLGTASHLIYSAFAGGWQYFSFSTMKEKNQVESNSKVFEYLGIVSFIATSFICALSFFLFRILFSEEYLDGYIVAPYLFFSPLLLMLYQVIVNQFLVIKKTWPTILILSAGAAINVIANYYLIPLIGIEGASIATLFGYIISVILCMVTLCCMKLMVVSFRFGMATLLMVGFFCAWRFLFSDKTIIGLIVAFFFSTLWILLYKKEVQYLVTRILKVIKKHR